MQAFVPKNRKPKFDVTLNIIDLTNIPLVVGAVYVKWHLPSSVSAEHRGKTDRSPISEHRAVFDFTKDLTVRLTVDKNQSLQPCEIHFEVTQEYDEGGRGRVHLGNVTLNLAEYAIAAELNADDEAEAENENGMITRRYLMQDSKVNATLKIGIAMKQIEGDSNFIAPALRSAMMVGGFVGIMNTDAGEADDMPSIANKSRELSEAQDTYRRTLAASWACERGELPPDQLIENLFSGGDGGKMTVPKLFRPLRETWGHPPPDDSSNSSDPDLRLNSKPGLLSPEMAKDGHRRDGSNGSGSGSGTEGSAGSYPLSGISVSGRGSIEQQMQHSQPSHHHHSHRERHHHHHHRRKQQREYQEITEFDLRDDLRSWEIHAK